MGAEHESEQALPPPLRAEPGQSSEGDAGERTFFERLHDAFGPIAAGVLLDTLDVATFGHLGLFLGPVVGGLVGLWLSKFYGFSGTNRWVLVVVCGAYLSMPFTEVLPLATLVAGIARFREPRG